LKGHKGQLFLFQFKLDPGHCRYPVVQLHYYDFVYFYCTTKTWWLPITWNAFDSHLQMMKTTAAAVHNCTTVWVLDLLIMRKQLPGVIQIVLQLLESVKYDLILLTSVFLPKNGCC